MDVFRNYIRNTLLDTLTHIFKYSHPNVGFLKIEGLVTVTADDQVFIVHVDKLCNLNGGDGSEYNLENDLPHEKGHSIKAEPMFPFEPKEVPQWTVKSEALPEHLHAMEREAAFPPSLVTENCLHGEGGLEPLTTHHLPPQSESFYEDEGWDPGESCSPEQGSESNYQNAAFHEFRPKAGLPHRKCFKAKRRKTSLRETQGQPSYIIGRGSAGGRGGTGGRIGRSEEFILTESFHVCAYPGCGKRFKLRRNLLRHQTKKHGRIPTRKTKRRNWSYGEGEEEEDEEEEEEEGEEEEEEDL